MTEHTSILVIGGTGVFGSLIVGELLASPAGFHVAVAARHVASFRAVFPVPHPRLDFCPVDLYDEARLAGAVAGRAIVILAAGPFQRIGAAPALAAVRAGAHFLDINDSPAYFLRLREVAEDLRAAGKTVVTGLSSLPGISIPLFCHIKDDFDVIEAIEIGLFIGNANAKGAAAVASALENLTTPVTVWRDGKKRTTMGWSHKMPHPFPQPIGAVPAYSFASPDPLVFAEIARFNDLAVKVAFESATVRRLFTVLHQLAHLGWYGAVRQFIMASRPWWNKARRFGTERGCVSVVVRGKKAGAALTRQAAVLALTRGQRLAALPCVIAVEGLNRGEIKGAGLLRPDQALAPREFLQRLNTRGLQVWY
jgi:saccharopine dehydrogenase-like NADP-dependent oxidoreductase